MNSSHPTNAIRKLLETTHVRDIETLKHQTLIQFHEDDLIRDVFDVNYLFPAYP